MTTNRHAIVVLACVTLPLVGCRADDRPPQEGRPVSAGPGTYALRLCRGVCEKSQAVNVIRSGWVVLDTVPIDLEGLPDSIGRELKYDVIYLRGKANGCFRLDEDRPDIKTYAGGMGGGLIAWRRTGHGDSIAFALYHSPDAGHSVTLGPTITGLEGRGHSWGVGMAAVDFPDDIVVGDYVGPPNQKLCRQAGLAALRRAVVLRQEMRALPPPAPPPRPSA